jgi:futalosine hydrolase
MNSRLSQSRSSVTDVLVVAAFHPELAPLRSSLGEGLRGPVGGKEIVATPVGIGLPQASVGAALRIADARPGLVVLVGTCGAYPGTALRIGDVVAARRILLVDPAVVDEVAQFPDPMSIATEADRRTHTAFVAAGAVSADVATTLAVTVDDGVATRVARASGAQAEHLEAHGVASASATLGVPFAALLGVANVVGSRARQEWRANHRSAAEAAIRVLTAWLASPPLP